MKTVGPLVSTYWLLALVDHDTELSLSFSHSLVLSFSHSPSDWPSLRKDRFVMKLCDRVSTVFGVVSFLSKGFLCRKIGWMACRVTYFSSFSLGFFVSVVLWVGHTRSTLDGGGGENLSITRFLLSNERGKIPRRPPSAVKHCCCCCWCCCRW